MGVSKSVIATIIGGPIGLGIERMVRAGEKQKEATKTMTRDRKAATEEQNRLLKQQQEATERLQTLDEEAKTKAAEKIRRRRQTKVPTLLTSKSGVGITPLVTKKLLGE